MLRTASAMPRRTTKRVVLRPGGAAVDVVVGPVVVEVVLVLVDVVGPVVPVDEEGLGIMVAAVVDVDEVEDEEEEIDEVDDVEEVEGAGVEVIGEPGLVGIAVDGGDSEVAPTVGPCHVTAHSAPGAEPFTPGISVFITVDCAGKLNSSNMEPGLVVAVLPLMVHELIMNVPPHPPKMATPPA